MTSRALGVIALVLSVIVACAMYALKDQVQRLEGELHRARAAIGAERTALGRLRTEWALLSQPGRLERLARNHLGLVPAQPGQIVRIGDIPYRADLTLSKRQWQVVLPSGADAALRFKPSPKLQPIDRRSGAAAWHAMREGP